MQQKKQAIKKAQKNLFLSHQLFVKHHPRPLSYTVKVVLLPLIKRVVNNNINYTIVAYCST